MSAVQAIKQFRLQQIRALPKHIQRFGPLTELTADAPKSRNALQLPNPFIPRRNPKTGKWIEPKYSLRRQAELIKKAKASNTVHLLPPGPKLPRPSVLAAALSLQAKHAAVDAKKPVAKEVWANPVRWEGKFVAKEVAGADVGTRLYAGKKRMFKGHRWERLREKRDKKRSVLMRDMARRVHNYKAVRILSFVPSGMSDGVFCSTTKGESPTLSSRRALQRRPSFHSSGDNRLLVCHTPTCPLYRVDTLTSFNIYLGLSVYAGTRLLTFNSERYLTKRASLPRPTG